MTIEPERSEEYRILLQELRGSFISAADTAVRLYEQGKKDGLSNEAIRNDIEIALEGVVKERRLREILPLELKRSYTIKAPVNADFDDSALIADLGFNNGIEDPDVRELTIQAYRELLQEGVTFESQYDKLLEVLTRYTDIMSRRYIPQLCEAVHRENPRWRTNRIKNEVARDLMNTYPNIVHDQYLLSWTIPKKKAHKK
jgi:hypothetical protein